MRPPVSPEVYAEVLRILRNNPQGVAVFELLTLSKMRMTDRQWRHALERMLKDEEVIVVKRSKNHVRYHHPDIPLQADQLPGAGQQKKTKKQVSEPDGVFSGEFNAKERHFVTFSRDFMACIAPLRASRGSYAAM